MTTKQWQWQLIKTFELPKDKQGRDLWRVDFTPNYHEQCAELRKEYQDYQVEFRGDVHEKKEFWVLLPTPENTPEPVDLYETDTFKMDELAGEYSGVEKRFIVYNKVTESGVYTQHGVLLLMNYDDCKIMIDNLTNAYQANTMNNQNNPTESDNLEAKTAFEGELDTLHETIENMLRDDNLEAYPELNCALQDVHSLIEKLDIKIDYYNC